MNSFFVKKGISLNPPADHNRRENMLLRNTQDIKSVALPAAPHVSNYTYQRGKPYAPHGYNNHFQHNANTGYLPYSSQHVNTDSSSPPGQYQPVFVKLDNQSTQLQMRRSRIMSHQRQESASEQQGNSFSREYRMDLQASGVYYWNNSQQVGHLTERPSKVNQLNLDQQQANYNQRNNILHQSGHTTPRLSKSQQPVPLLQQSFNRIVKPKKQETSVTLSPGQKTVQRQNSINQLMPQHKQPSIEVFLKPPALSLLAITTSPSLPSVCAPEEQSSRWHQQKKALQKEFSQKTKTLQKSIEQKNMRIKQLQGQASEADKKHKMQILQLQYEMRKTENNKNRLLVENESQKKLVQTQRKKNQNVKQEINKMMFFQDDLIHTKDYDILKKQLQEALTQNEKMFNEHQMYILTVKEQRKKYELTIEELRSQIKSVSGVLQGYKLKFEAVNVYSEDKMRLIKTQNQYNFLKKKNTQQLQVIIQKQQQLAKATTEIQRLSDAMGQNKQSNVMDELNMAQINDSIASYERRIQELKQELAKKTQMYTEVIRKSDYFSGELRKLRDQKSLFDRRQKNQQNNLKDQVETLERSLQGQREIHKKKLNVLEESIQRKGKEIASKDKFIKDFLISRAKNIAQDDFKTLFTSLSEYFDGLKQQ